MDVVLLNLPVGPQSECGHGPTTTSEDLMWMRHRHTTLVLHRTDHRMTSGTLVSDVLAFVGGSSEAPRPPVVRKRQGPTGLSEAERDVAELVVLGLTNAEMGRRLYISRHTVDARLRRIYSKLAVANRTELAAVAGEGGL